VWSEELGVDAKRCGFDIIIECTKASAQNESGILHILNLRDRFLQPAKGRI